MHHDAYKKFNLISMPILYINLVFCIEYCISIYIYYRLKLNGLSTENSNINVTDRMSITVNNSRIELFERK